ncbi:UvrD-helicase domain-containing protein [Hyphobacterium sp.]|jgi:ATP-dependent helicase/nuclease subunit A|uniref:UvrD-helicase domain-containing protein n=1 Tax=Hyphobacterium sp. TaxID=2004662 RepID=UPI003BA8728C
MADAVKDATEQQTLAAQPDYQIHVEANAGSGKTRVLVNRVARLLLDGAKPDKILCLTYTRAAAGEMKSRLFDTLGSWSIADDAALTKKLNALHNDEGGSYSRDALADARRLFARALETPGGLAVQTIHAFCQSLLQRFPLEAGLAPGFEVADDGEARAIAAEARRGLLLEAGRNSGLHTALATLHNRGSDAFELVTRTAASKRLALAHLLIAEGGAVLRSALRRELGLSEQETVASLIDSAWADAPHAALRSAAETLAGGIQADQNTAQAIDTALAARSPDEAYGAYSGAFLTQQGKFRARIIGAKTAKDHPAVAELMAGEATRMTEIITRVAAADMAETSEAAMTVAADYIARYETGLAARRRLDYADLIAYAVKLLQDSSARDWVRYKLDAGIDHVLVDEAQDNAPEQWQVIGALVDEFFTGNGIARERPRTVFTVGDEKQSIYSFQGAEPKQFLAWGERIARGAADAALVFQQPSLAVSFRSSAVILNAVDTAFEPERLLGEIKALSSAPETKFTADPATLTAPYPPAQDAFERYQPHRPAWKDRPGCVELWPAVPRDPAGEKPDPAAPVDRESAASAAHRLARLIATEIARILADGDGVHDEGHRDLRPALPSDIMVLVAKRGGFFRELIRQLKLRGVPVAGADRMILTEELAVQDLICLAEVALNPLDDLKLAELLKSPFLDPADAPPPIDEEKLFSLAHGRGESALWSRLMDSQDDAFADAQAMIRRARQRIETAGVHGFFADFLHERTPTGETRLKRLFARLGEEARDPVEEFLARAIAFDQSRTASLAGFIAEMKAGSGEIKREMDDGRGEVRVMTVHGSKGLEAPIVILPDTTAKPALRADRGLYADDRLGLAWAPPGKIQPDLSDRLKLADEKRAEGEHARLLYVALTRASQRLVVCGWKRGAGEGRIESRSWYERLDTLWQGGDWTEIESPVCDPDGAPLAGRRLGSPSPALGGAARPDADTQVPEWARTLAPEEEYRARTVAPSHLVEGDEGPVYSPLTDDGGRRFRRGALIHKLLETLPDLPDPRRAAAAEAYLASQSDLDDAARSEIAQETLAVLSHPDFAALFGPGSLAEVSLTGTAPGLPKDIVLNGQVDRLVVTDHEVLIVDYKTNRPPPADASGVPRLYLAQMAAYQAVLQAIHPDRKVRCALVWTDGPRLMELADDVLADALASGVKA